MANVPRIPRRKINVAPKRRREIVKRVAQSDNEPRLEVVRPDHGGWISGPMLDNTALRDGRLYLSEDAKIAAALRIGCETHDVPVGMACPLIRRGACLTRLADALGDAI